MTAVQILVIVIALIPVVAYGVVLPIWIWIDERKSKRRK